MKPILTGLSRKLSIIDFSDMNILVVHPLKADHFNVPRGRSGMLYTSVQLYTSVLQSRCTHVQLCRTPYNFVIHVSFNFVVHSLKVYDKYITVHVYDNVVVHVYDKVAIIYLTVQRSWMTCVRQSCEVYENFVIHVYGDFVIHWCTIIHQCGTFRFYPLVLPTNQREDPYSPKFQCPSERMISQRLNPSSVQERGHH